MHKPIQFSLLGTSELLKLHNEMAAKLRLPKLKTWKGTRCALVQRVALIRTHRAKAPEAKPAKRVKRRQPMRTMIVRLLARVHHYELDGKRVTAKTPRAVSIGMSYGEILKRVKAKFPHSKCTTGQLRWNAAMVRAGQPGFKKCQLPHKRPRTV